MPRAIVYNSVEEREMIEARLGQPGRARATWWAWARRCRRAWTRTAFGARHGLTGPFVLYVGRIDENKGCRQLFDFFRRYRAETGSRAAAGPHRQAGASTSRPTRGSCTWASCSDEEKWDALAACGAAGHALAPGEPVHGDAGGLVGGAAGAGQRQVRGAARPVPAAANAGLYYTSYEEFREALALLESDGAARQLGRNGRLYFEKHYTWDIVERKYLCSDRGGELRRARRRAARSQADPASVS